MASPLGTISGRTRERYPSVITRAHITRRASQDGVSARTVERDYVLGHIVAAVAELGDDSNLVFKGGTALRLCYFADYRYSADLDFSVIDGTIEDGRKVMTQALGRVRAGGDINGLRLTDDRPPRIAYVGPLRRARTLKLDMADDELVFNTEYRSLLRRWDDFPEEATVHVYTLLEIAAEKLRCVLQRVQCRDLFDLHLLFGDAEVSPAEAAEVFRPKAQHRGIDPASFASRYRERIKQYQKRWESELGEHVPQPTSLQRSRAPYYAPPARSWSAVALGIGGKDAGGRCDSPTILSSPEVSERERQLPVHHESCVRAWIAIPIYDSCRALACISCRHCLV